MTGIVINPGAGGAAGATGPAGPTGPTGAAGAAGPTIPKNTQTVNYSLVLTDAGEVVEINSATAKTLTVTKAATVAWVTDTVIEVCQLGVGQVTIAPDAGVTLHFASSLTTRAQYSTATLRYRGSDEWVVGGDCT